MANALAHHSSAKGREDSEQCASQYLNPFPCHAPVHVQVLDECINLLSKFHHDLFCTIITKPRRKIQLFMGIQYNRFLFCCALHLSMPQSKSSIETALEKDCFEFHKDSHNQLIQPYRLFPHCMRAVYTGVQCLYLHPSSHFLVNAVMSAASN